MSPSLVGPDYTALTCPAAGSFSRTSRGQPVSLCPPLSLNSSESKDSGGFVFQAWVVTAERFLPAARRIPVVQMLLKEDRDRCLRHFSTRNTAHQFEECHIAKAEYTSSCAEIL